MYKRQLYALLRPERLLALAYRFNVYDNGPRGAVKKIARYQQYYAVQQTAERVARLVNGRMLDYMEFDDGFAIVKMRPPKETQGFTLAQSQIRKKYGVTVVGVKSAGEEFTYASPETLVSSHDVLIVSGHSELVERFASRP